MHAVAFSFARLTPLRHRSATFTDAMDYIQMDYIQISCIQIDCIQLDYMSHYNTGASVARQDESYSPRQQALRHTAPHTAPQKGIDTLEQ